jgi:ubiquinone biosynthesis protein
MFEEFDYTPVASGSVSQVYKATFHQKTVAVKVRHPKIGNNLEKDIDLLFMFSKFFSIFSKKFEIPVTSG